MGTDERRTAYPGEPSGPAIEERDGTWHIRSLPLVREVLRLTGEDTLQAGFAAEAIRRTAPLRNLPVLYADGPSHRAQRTAIAGYFAPATVAKRYQTLMVERADRLLSRLDGGEPVDLSELTLHFSAQVAARVIGLTNSDQERMAHRLARFFDQPESMLAEEPTGMRRATTFLRSLPSLTRLAVFHRQDVRPAVRARRAQPQQDVISHLIEQDYDDTEILVECLAYGAAGMVTTREFLQMVTWHLLERDDLRAVFVTGDSTGRAALLHEVLRLEPVVGHLHRRTTTEIVLTEEGRGRGGDGGADEGPGEGSGGGLGGGGGLAREHRIPAGARLDLYVRAANADPAHITPDPLALRPGRGLPPGIRAEVMSFGDGPHRCPGNAVAMTESEIFLSRLLARDLELVGEPHLEWEDLIEGYAVRGLHVRDRGGRWSPPAVGQTGGMSQPQEPTGTETEAEATDAEATEASGTGEEPPPAPSQEAVDLAHALFDLARQGDAARLGAYVDAGVPVDLTDPQGNTLLMLAAYHGHADAVRELAGRGADVERQNDRGQSPLAGAVFKGEEAVVVALLEHGADPDAGTPTARQTAEMFGRQDLLDAGSQTPGDQGGQATSR